MRRIALTLFLLPFLPLFFVLAHETGFPEQTLKKVFPEASGFTPRKKMLTPEQLKQVELQSGSKVQRNDNPFSYYVALGKSPDASGVLGTVLMVDAKGPKGGMDLAVGVRRDGSVQRVVVTENADDPNVSSAGFLGQIEGKSVQSPLKVGQDIHYSGDPKAAQALLDAVRRGLYLLAAAQSK